MLLPEYSSPEICRIADSDFGPDTAFSFYESYEQFIHLVNKSVHIENPQEWRISGQCSPEHQKLFNDALAKIEEASLNDEIPDPGFKNAKRVVDV